MICVTKKFGKHAWVKIVICVLGIIAWVTVTIMYFCGCFSMEAIGDRVIRSIGRDFEGEYYVEGFRDYTEYGEFKFEKYSLEKSRYFKQLDEKSIAELNLYLDEYERCVYAGEEDEITRNYDFDKSVVSADDWFYIEVEYPEDPLECFYVYFLDVSEGIVYYFHSSK